MCCVQAGFEAVEKGEQHEALGETDRVSQAFIPWDEALLREKLEVSGPAYRLGERLDRPLRNTAVVVRTRYHTIV